MTGSLLWELRLPDAAIELRDLPVELIAEVSRSTEVPWPLVIGRPCDDLRVANLLVGVTARYLGVSPPANLEATDETLVDLFVDVSDREVD